MSKAAVQTMPKTSLTLERGLPANIDAERFVLGSILLDDSRFLEAGETLRRDDFALEKHRRIFARMMEMHERGEKIDRVTIANELQRYNELESVDGLSYLISLDDGLPQISNLGSYIDIIREKGALRRIAFTTQYALNRALTAEDEPAAILASLSEQIEDLGAGLARKASLIEDLPAVGETVEKIRYIREPELPEGAVVGLTGDSGSGKSTLATAWARDAIADGRPVLVLDRENPRAVVQDRMRRLGFKDGPLLRWAGGWCNDAYGPESAAVLRWACGCEIKPLIIVDSLSAFIEGNENDAGDMRRFTHKLRRLADLGATVALIHHDGKGASSSDFRGSTDFKASLDQSFHVVNIGPTGLLDKLRLRVFKSRYGLSGDIVYRYAGGAMVRDTEPLAREKGYADQLRSILRMNPGITVTDFEKRVNAAKIPRGRARDFVNDGVLEGSIRRETLPNNKQRLAWEGDEIE